MFSPHAFFVPLQWNSSLRIWGLISWGPWAPQRKPSPMPPTHSPISTWYNFFSVPGILVGHVGNANWTAEPGQVGNPPHSHSFGLYRVLSRMGQVEPFFFSSRMYKEGICSYLQKAECGPGLALGGSGVSVPAAVRKHIHVPGTRTAGVWAPH